MSITALAFLLFFGATLLAALFRNPRYGLYAYVGTFYLHPVDRWWGSGLPDLRWSLLAAAVALGATLRLPAEPDRASWTANTGAKLVIALTVWIWVQNLWALDADAHLDLTILYTKYVVLIYLIYRLIDDEQGVRNFLLVHVLGCFYLGVLCLEASGEGRLEGVGGPGINEANALGMHLGTGALAAAILLVRGSLAQRAFALAALAFIVNGIVQTESRGAFLGVATGGLTIFVLSPTGMRKLWVVLGVLGLAALLHFAPDNYWERMGTIATSAEKEGAVDQSSETRIELAAAQWQMFLAYPLGSGHRGTAYLSPRYLSEENMSRNMADPSAQQERSSHNTFMTALAEQGIPGVFLFTGLIIWIARASFSARARFRSSNSVQLQLYVLAVAGSLGAVIVAGMFTDYFKAEVFIWEIALLAVLGSLPAQVAPVEAANGQSADQSSARIARQTR